MREMVKDMERMERGELTFPTVSSFGTMIDGVEIDRTIVYFDENGEISQCPIPL
jgi:hypothetical protein